MRLRTAGFARPCGIGLGLGAALLTGPAAAGTLELGSGLSLDYLANLTYSAVMRADDADSQLLANVNGDDGNRAFDQSALINNRAAVLAETNLHFGNHGVFVRGSAFYDDVYFHDSDNDSPETLNRADRADHFSDATRDRLGARARLLDVYAYASIPIGSTALDLRAGNQVVSWGESLFFPNMSGAQAPADATKSNVPGTEVKDILLPVGQVYAQWGLTDRLSVLGYYQWQWKSTELNPTDAFYSSSDVVGPGAEFLLVPSLAPLVPFGISTQVPRGKDDKPDDSGQWGAGVRYRLGEATELSAYHIRYSDKNPVGVTINSTVMTLPVVGTLVLPTSYNVAYTDDIKMTALSLSTEVAGTAVGGEVSYRQGAGLNINVGPTASPTPGRGDVLQANLNATKLFLPTPLWDTMLLLGEVSYVHVEDQDGIDVPTQTGTVTYDDLSNSRDATALQLLLQFGYKQIWSGWDLTLSLVNGYGVNGKSAIAGALGSYTGEGDIRYSAGPTFKYLNNLEFGLAYNGYAGGASLDQRPLADRSNVAFNAKYSF